MMASIQTVGLWREAEALQHQKMLYGFLGISTKKTGSNGWRHLDYTFEFK